MVTTKINFKYYHTIVVLIPFLIVVFRQLIIYLQDPAVSVKNLEGKLKNLNRFQKIAEQRKLSEFELNKTVVITAVACGGKDRFEELSVMMKSAIMYSQTQPLKFVIFTDQLGPNIEKILEYWKIFSKQHLSWEIRSPLFTNVAEASILPTSFHYTKIKQPITYKYVLIILLFHFRIKKASRLAVPQEVVPLKDYFFQKYYQNIIMSSMQIPISYSCKIQQIFGINLKI